MKEPYLPFFSEIAVREHVAYRRHLAARLSALKKSFPGRESLDTREILTARLRGAEREMLPLAGEILLHDIFFSSFSEKQGKAPTALRRYSSDAAFRYALFEKARGARDGFLCVFPDRRGDARFEIVAPPDFCMTALPRLALDLAEHAYFYDFGFDREKYFAAAILLLDLSLL
ncbi:MAG TPA: hypothetical protein DDY70_01780 [Clostridiales bacterium]|nr:hypothetical protein [Clostridiales bacterium]